MANYFLSYDLNGKHPTHAEMDEHLKGLNGTVRRVLETVWYVHTSLSMSDVFDHANDILSGNDRLLVIHANNARMRNLLVPSEKIVDDWNA